MPRLPADELREWLETRNLTHEEQRIVIERYAAVTVADAWSRERTYQWLDRSIRDVQSADLRPGGAAAMERESRNAVVAAQDEQQQRVENSTQAVNDEIRRRMEQQRQRRSTVFRYGVDAGPSWDPDVISTSISVGVWVDEQGNPIDPNTMEPTDEPVQADAASVWDQLRGHRFNMGALASPFISERLGRTHREGPAAYSRFFTPSQAMALLGSMDENAILNMQRALWEAGLYREGGRPDWGIADAATREAFRMAFVEASQTPDLSVAQVLARLAENNLASIEQVPGTPGAQATMPAFAPTVTSTATLSQMIDDISQELFGKSITAEQRQSLIQRLQGQEVTTQQTQYAQDVAQQGQSGGPQGAQDIDLFMAAISGQESGGNYGAVNPESGARGRFQIMPANWGPWATRAGLGPSAPMTPENQEIVARQIMGDYFAQFGNWRDVAVAWYSGAGNVAANRNSTRPQGRYPSIASYANSIMDRMAALRAQAGRGPGDTPVPGMYPPIEAFDAAAEAEAQMRAMDPAGWAAHEFGQRAQEFYSLLGGVTGG